MDVELLFFGIIPMIIGIVILLKSIQICFRQKKFFDWIFLILISGTTFLAEYMLVLMFFTDAWPTFLPYILIILNLVLLFFQIYDQKNTNTT